MKLDTLLRLHADAANQAVKDAQPPPLDRIIGSARRSRRLSIAITVTMIAAAAATLVVFLMAGPTADLTPTTAAPATQPSPTTVATNISDGGAVVTTRVVPSPLEQAGIDLQDDILADGNITRSEFELAAAAMATCMKGHGLTDVTWSVDDDREGWSLSTGYASFDEAGEEAIFDLCFHSYVDRVLINP